MISRISRQNNPSYLHPLHSRRVQMLAGLIPADAPSGEILIGMCPGCDQITAATIPVGSGRGDLMQSRCCGCGHVESIVLVATLPPVGRAD